MKSKSKPLTLDEAPEMLAAILDPVWSKFSPEEKAARLRKVKRFVSTVNVKERSPIPQ
jgi:hypothetical protein